MSDDWKDALAALRGGMPAGEEPVGGEAEGAHAQASPTSHTLEIVYERKGRGGHPATIVVCPQDMDAGDVDALAGTLRRRLGVGGSARGGEILLQGDRRGALRAILPTLGFKTKG